MSDPVLTHTDEHGNATVILNRPDAHNAFSSALVVALTNALQDLERDPDVRAIVLMGQGENFSAGADLTSLKPGARPSAAAYERLAGETARMLQILHELKKPTIACVRGAAYGGAIGLICACDIAVAERHATFRFPEAKAGLTPAIVSPYVIAALGERAARRYMLTGEEFDAAEAYRIGLVHDLVEAEGLIPAVGTLLGHLYTSGPRALSLIKELVPAVARMPVAAAARDAEKRSAGIWTTPEAQEGVAAIQEERRPAWAETSPRGAAKRARKPARKTATKRR